MFKSLYTRIAIYSIVVILVSALISFLISNVYYHVHLKTSNDQKIMQTLQNAKRYQEDAHITNLDEYFTHISELNYQILTIDEDGHKKTYGSAFREDNLPKATVQHVLNGHAYHGIAERPYRLFITGFFDNETTNSVGLLFETPETKNAVFIRPDIGHTFSEFRIFLNVLITLMLIISIVLVISATYAIIKPIKQLKVATERLMDGDFNTPIRITRKDELGLLQYRFDTMRKSLKQLDDMRQHFVQNVSHEIKTPLTHIHHLLDQLRHAQSDELRATYIDDIYAITSRLSHLTKELLLLAELDNGEHIKFNDHMRLDQLLQEVIRREHFAADAKGIIMLSDLEEVYYTGNQRLLYQAFQNLITNAIKYAQADGMVEISLKAQEAHIMITITDDGKGMTPETQSKIFERFYKTTHNEQSNGLGLAIVDAIVRQHNGHIQVTSQYNVGSTFTITLPKQ